MQPLVFTPFLRPAVWGGRRLGELSQPLPADGRFGESWQLSGHPLHVSRVAEGPHAGRSLLDLCRDEAVSLFGPGAAAPQGFPLLLKYLDAEDWLSLQVHPGDDDAPRLANEPCGKTEAWVVLDARPEARIQAGLRPGVTAADLARALTADRAGDLLHSFTPRPGDCLFLPAGTVHAVGGGVLLAEVQQSSDATLRLHDWGRVGTDGQPRPLHVEAALQAIDWRRGPVTPVQAFPVQPESPALRRERLVECPYFRLDRWTIRDPVAVPPGLSLWMVVEGTAQLHDDTGYRRACRRGDTVLIPAAAPPLRWLPAAPPVLLHITLP